MANIGLRLVLDEMTRRRSAQLKRDTAKMALLGDPAKLDAMVGSFAEYLSPTTKKAKASKYGLSTEAIDSMIPKGHAMKGYGQELRERFKQALAKPSLRHMHPQQILHGLATGMYARPAKGDTKSRYERSLEFKRMADTAFFEFGEAELVKKPPQYEAWREEVNRREVAGIKDEPWLASPSDMAIAAGSFAVISGGLALPGGPPAMAMAGTTGAMGGVLLEAIFHPFRRAVHGTEWGRARMHSDSLIDQLKVHAATFGPELVAFPRIHKIAQRLTTVPKIVMKEVAAAPTAANVIKMSQVNKGFAGLSGKHMPDLLARLGAEIEATPAIGLGVTNRQHLIDLMKLIVTPPWGEHAYGMRRPLFKALAEADREGLAAIMRDRAMTRLAVPRGERGTYRRRTHPAQQAFMAEEGKVHESYRNFEKLDDIGVEEALTDPAGPMKGIENAAKRQASREYASGKLPAAKVEAASKKAKKVEDKLQGKARDKAVAALANDLKKIEEMRTREVAKFPSKAKEVNQQMDVLKASTIKYHKQYAATLGNTLYASEGVQTVARETSAIVPVETEMRVAQGVVSAEDVIADAVETGLTTEEGAAKLWSLTVAEPTEETAKLRGRYAVQSLRAEKMGTKEYPKPEYIVDTERAPALIKQDMEAMTSKDIYRSVDELEERLFNEHLGVYNEEGELVRGFRDIPTHETRTYAGGLDETTGELISPEGFPYERTEALSFDESALKIGEQRALLEQKMTNKQYQAREASLEMLQRKRVEEGLAVAGEDIPGFVSAEHMKKVATGHGAWTPETGYRLKPSDVEAGALGDLGAYPYLQLTEREARSAVGEIWRALEAGEITPNTALHRLAQVDEQILNSRAISDVDKMLMRDGLITSEVGERFTAEGFRAGPEGGLGATGIVTSTGVGTSTGVPISTASMMSMLRKMVAGTAFLAMMGVTPEIFSMFGPKEAEASSLVRGLGAAFRAGGRKLAAAEVKAGVEKIAQEAVDAGLTPFMAGPKDLIIRASQHMRGLPDSIHGGATNVIKKLKNFSTKNVKPGIRHKLMSPPQIFDEVLNIAEGEMNNPGVFRSSYQSAEYWNIFDSDIVLRNIMRETKIPGDPRVLGEMFDELVPYQIRHIRQNWHKQEIARLSKDIKKLRPKGGKKLDSVQEIDLAMWEESLKAHETAVLEFEGATKEFHDAWHPIAQRAAAESPSARVYFTVFDGPEFKKMPWMKDVILAPNEMQAAGLWKEWLLEWRHRIEELGEEVITGPYAPVILHPASQEAFKDVVTTGGEQAAAYMQFYKRSFDSLPLVPDFPTTMMRYIRDTERRIQNQAFWKKGFGGWEEVEARTQHIPLLKDAFSALREGVRPVEMTPGNKVSNVYVQFEAWKRLHLNPSAGGKHLMKMTGTMSTAGVMNSFRAMPQAFSHTIDRIIDAGPGKMKSLEKMGFTSRRAKSKAVLAWQRSMIPPRTHHQRLLDLGMRGHEELFSRWRGAIHKVQNVGAAWINLAELFDRGVSSAAGLQMAAKRGMTAEQAYYGSLDLIFKNNFFSRELNPAWMRNPKIRALFMFQGTPFKIFERRLVQAIRSGRAIKRMNRAVYDATKTSEGRKDLLRSIRTLKSSMKTTEQELKVNLITDAIKSEVDFFGTPVVAQTGKDLLITGAMMAGGYNVGMNLKHHLFHLPFLSGMTHDPVVAFSPGYHAVNRGYQQWKNAEGEDTDFLFTTILKKWLGPAGPLPDIVWKGKRITDSDIPELYGDSKFRYLFAVPHKERY